MAFYVTSRCRKSCNEKGGHIRKKFGPSSNHTSPYWLLKSHSSQSIVQSSVHLFINGVIPNSSNDIYVITELTLLLYFKRLNYFQHLENHFKIRSSF